MKKIYFALFGLAAIHLLLLANFRFTAWPEMISYPYLINNGFTLYKDFVHPYPPLLTIVLSVLFKFFGYKLIVLKIVTWAMILLNDFLIFAIAKKITGKSVDAFLSVTFYVFTQPFLEGNQLWFDLAIVTPVLAATYFWIEKKYTKSGFLFAVACLVKQTAGIFLIAALLYFLFRKERLGSILRFFMGPIILGILLLAYLYLNSSLTEFINWNLVYPFTFWNKFPGYVQMNLTNSQVVALILLFLPLLLAFRKIKKNVIFVIFLLCSLVLIYPRFSFFHFQLSLAFVAILYSMVSVYSVALVSILSILFFAKGYRQEARFWNIDDIDLGNVISRQVDKDEIVFFLGLPSNYYVLSGRVPPKPWLDNYGWYFEVPGVSESTINRWEQNMPTKIIWQAPSVGNWFDLGTYQPKKVTEWIVANYNRLWEVKSGIWLWEKK